MTDKELLELMPDDLFQSKDWKHGDARGRIIWLTHMLASKIEEVDFWVDMLNKRIDSE